MVVSYKRGRGSYGKNHFSNVNANKGIITRDYKNWDTFTLADWFEGVKIKEI